MATLWLDLETYSSHDIKQVGGYKYASNCKVLLFAFAIDDGPVIVWDLTSRPENEPLLDKPVSTPGLSLLKQTIGDGKTIIIAHNAFFERRVLAEVWGLVFPYSSWRCSMVKGFGSGYPGKLEAVGSALGLDEDKAKLKTGNSLINKFCSPDSRGQQPDPDDYPEKWEQFIDYCARDVETMRTVWNKLPDYGFTNNNLDAWFLDQRINDRGVHVDLPLVRKIKNAIDVEQIRVDEQLFKATSGKISTVRQNKALLEFLHGENVWVNSVKEKTVANTVALPGISDLAREVLNLRQAGGKSSILKYKRIDLVQDDSVIRGMFQFNGAKRTRRWAGRLVQLTNLQRPTVSLAEQDTLIEAFSHGHALNMGVHKAAGEVLRRVFIPPLGHKLVVSDFSNIESRILAWLARDEHKLDLYRQYDAGTGADIYKLTYANAFNAEIDSVSSDQRQIGKVMELALGYAGGIAAFIKMADGYSLEFDKIVTQVKNNAPRDVIEEAFEFYHWQLSKGVWYQATKNVAVACEVLKRLWRRDHPRVVDFWDQLNVAAISAVQCPECIFTVGSIDFRRTNFAGIDYLLIDPPSGGLLVYPYPEVCENRFGGPAVSYMGIDTKNKWSRIETYGGKMAENLSQQQQREVLANCMPRVEKAGFRIVLHVYDEIAAIVPKNREDLTHELLSSVMSQGIPWAKGLPIVAKGYTANRYKKG